MGVLTLLVLGIYIIRALMQFLRSYMAHLAGWGVVADVRKHIYEHLQALSLRYYEDKQTGQLMSRVINDTELFEQLISHAIPDVIVNVITLVGVSVILLFINWRLTLLTMIPIPLVILSLRVYARYVRPAFRERQKELGNLNAILNDSLQGIREIKAFTREVEEMKRVSQGIDRYRVSLLGALKLMATFQPFIEFTSSSGCADRDLFWRQVGSAGGALSRRPGDVLPIPGNLLPAGARSEQCLGADPGFAGRCRPGS